MFFLRQCPTMAEVDTSCAVLILLISCLICFTKISINGYDTTSPVRLKEYSERGDIRYYTIANVCGWIHRLMYFIT